MPTSWISEWGREVVEEALDVAVDEADYGYADGWGCLGGGVVWGEAEGEEAGGEEEFGEAHRDGFQCNALALVGDGRERSRLSAMPTEAHPHQQSWRGPRLARCDRAKMTLPAFFPI